MPHVREYETGSSKPFSVEGKVTRIVHERVSDRAKTGRTESTTLNLLEMRSCRFGPHELENAALKSSGDEYAKSGAAEAERQRREAEWNEIDAEMKKSIEERGGSTQDKDHGVRKNPPKKP